MLFQMSFKRVTTRLTREGVPGKDSLGAFSACLHLLVNGHSSRWLSVVVVVGDDLTVLSVDGRVVSGI